MHRISKLLFVSSNAPEKFNAMLEAFSEIEGLTVVPVHRYEALKDYFSRPYTVLEKVFEKLKYPRDAERHNERIIEAGKKVNPDAVFVVKGNHIRPNTLKLLKSLQSCPKLISWSQDDMYASHNRSAYYSNGLKHYDLVVTQKSYNIHESELPSLGARRLLFQNKSFSPRVHRRYDPDPAFAHDVLFVGSAERDRFEVMNALAGRGIEIHIYGSGWDRPPFSAAAHPNLKISNRNLLGADYGRALSSARICLGFLRKQNRDLQTSRTIEIPACAGFMLAEFSDEQAALFTPETEAVYFQTVEEAESKIRFYLNNEVPRRKIADAGFRKCREAGYSYTERAKKILEVVASLS